MAFSIGDFIKPSFSERSNLELGPEPANAISSLQQALLNRFAPIRGGFQIQDMVKDQRTGEYKSRNFLAERWFQENAPDTPMGGRAPLVPNMSPIKPRIAPASRWTRNLSDIFDRIRFGQPKGDLYTGRQPKEDQYKLY